MTFFNTFKKSKLSYFLDKQLEEVNIDEINEGVSQNDIFLFYRKKEFIKVYDRICDHNAGKLFLQGKNAFCPLHGWELDLKQGQYANTSCIKEPLLTINEYELDSPLVEVEVNKPRLKTLDFQSKKNLTIRFLNHACLHFNIENNISFATDPWIFGSAFCNGWWLSKESPDEVFELLNQCNFIYISHNHPDHLHPLSLKYLRKDMTILTAGFETNSTKMILEECGFTDVIEMDFSSRLVNESYEFAVSILKSGDFRDDSGILIEIGEFKGLLTVDSNFLNFGKLPSVDLLASSFAGGASGFPLCFENYDEKEKKSVILRNIKSIKSTNTKNLEITKAKFFMPYAGFFSEKASRDIYIKKNNVKNKIEDYKSMCKLNFCNLLDLSKNQFFKFQGNTLIKEFEDKSKRYIDKPINEYLKHSIKLSNLELNNLLFNYFSNAEFHDDLVLDLITTNDDFSLINERLKIDFSTHQISTLSIDFKNDSLEKKSIEENKRYLQIKVRREELINVVFNKKPWEDLSIGFQCRIYRNPNVYNSKFWFYFTNVYISINVPKLNNV